MRKLLSSLALAAATVAAPVALHASPLSGQFSIQGTATNIGTTLYFDDPTIVTGSANTITGAFSSILTPGQNLAAGMPIVTGSIYGSDPTTIIPYSPYTPGSVTLIWSDKGGGFLTGNISTLTETTIGSGSQTTYDFFGTGVLSDPNYGTAPASFTFSTQQNGAVTFSATVDSSPVPEPSSLALFGTGILGLAGVVSKKFLA